MDIHVALQAKRFAVVEIETTGPLPGAFQLIKYRALRCAELGIPLDSPDVLAILVAWQIPTAVRKFCQTYGIQCYEKQL